MTGEPLFARVARESRIPAPAIAAPAQDAAAWARRVWGAFPAWGFDAAYLDEAGRSMLPRALAVIGIGPARSKVGARFTVMAELEPLVLGPRLLKFGLPSWPLWRDMLAAWPVLATDAFAGAEIIRFDLSPTDETPLLLHPVSLEWACPALVRQGDGLVALAAWRWEISETKAAWRLARRLGLERPYP